MNGNVGELDERRAMVRSCRAMHVILSKGEDPSRLRGRDASEAVGTHLQVRPRSSNTALSLPTPNACHPESL